MTDHGFTILTDTLAAAEARLAQVRREALALGQELGEAVRAAEAAEAEKRSHFRRIAPGITLYVR